MTLTNSKMQRRQFLRTALATAGGVAALPAGAVDDGAIEADEVALQFSGERIHHERRRASAAARIVGVLVNRRAPGVRCVPVLVVP